MPKEYLELIESAVLLESIPSMPEGNKSKKTMYMHSLYAPYIYNGSTGVAKIFVEKYWHEGTEKLREYEVKNIEPLLTDKDGKSNVLYTKNNESIKSILAILI